MKTKLIIFSLLLFSFVNSNAQTTSIASGSGIAISTDGFIATNYHVVEGGIEFFVDVFTNGVKKSYKAEVIKTDEENDLAIIKIADPAFKNFRQLPYSFKMQGINVGETVFAMGYPRPGLQGEEVKVTDGIISSKTGFQNDNKTYQISAPIQPGNSGGPLFDNEGNLIGLTNAGIPSGQNVGYAIKIAYLNNLLDMVENFPAMPLKTTITGVSFTEKIKTLSNFTVLIRVTVPNCDLKTPSELFYKIGASSSYEDVSELFNKTGDNYRTDGTGSESTVFFKWYFCESQEIYVDVWFRNNEIILAMKSFKNEMCNTNITDECYKKIKTGMSYSDVCEIMMGVGDKFRNDFEDGGNDMKFYKWYDCKNNELFFEVWFLSGKVHLVRKGDDNEINRLLGK